MTLVNVVPHVVLHQKMLVPKAETFVGRSNGSPAPCGEHLSYFRSGGTGYCHLEYISFLICSYRKSFWPKSKKNLSICDLALPLFASLYVQS